MRSIVFAALAALLSGCFPTQVVRAPPAHAPAGHQAQGYRTAAPPPPRAVSAAPAALGAPASPHWQVVGQLIQGRPGLSSDTRIYVHGDEAYVLPSRSCIVTYLREPHTNTLSKRRDCHNVTYRLTERGLQPLPPLPLDQGLTGMTKWNGKLLVAALKVERGVGKRGLSHGIIHELAPDGRSWRVFAPYGFTKRFYRRRTGDGVVFPEIGGLPGGPLYFAYGTPRLRVIAYERGAWRRVPDKGASRGSIAGERGQIIDGHFYFSFLDYGREPSGPRIKRISPDGTVADLGGYPFARATNTNVAFSGDGQRFMVITGRTRKRPNQPNPFDLWQLVGGRWTPMSKAGLPDNLTHYSSATHRGAFYVTGRIAPPSGTVQSRATVFRYDGQRWWPVGGRGVTELIPNFPNLFSMSGQLYLLYSNHRRGGFTLMRLVE